MMRTARWYLLLMLVGSLTARKSSVDMIVYHGTVVTMNDSKEIIQQGAVALKNGLIVAVDTEKKILSNFYARKKINAKNGLILPGLINGHTHAPMVFFRGMADDLVLKDWLHNHIFPAERKHLTYDFCYWGTLLALVEMIECGTTTIADGYYFSSAVARACETMGVRAIIGQTIIDYKTVSGNTPEEALANAITFIKEFKNHPLIIPALAPHATYSCSTQTLLATKKASDDYDVPMLMHISETKHGVNKIKQIHHKSPINYLHDLGFLNKRLVASHVVHATDEELDLLAQHGVGVIHNPSSNLKLSSGIAPLTHMLKKDIAVGLGTDGAASNNTLNMVAEMRLASLLQKGITDDPTAINAYQALELATIGGAKALHIDHLVGSLEQNKKADLIIVGLDAYHQLPVYNVLSQFVYASRSSDVKTVIIDGKVVMHNRRLGKKQLLREIRLHAEHYKKQIVKK